MGKILLTIIIGVGIAVIIFNAVATLINLLIWGLVALLALIASAGFLTSQIVLFWLVINRFGPGVRDILIDNSLNPVTRFLFVTMAVILTGLVIGVTELVMPGLIGKILLPGLFAAAVITHWLVANWASVVPGFLGWQPALDLNNPDVPWSNPTLLTLAAVSPFLGCLVAIRFAWNPEVLQNISFRPFWLTKGRNRWK